MVKGREDFYHSPTLFISETDKYPSAAANDKSCGVLGMNICTINHEVIQEGDTFYLGIFCRDDCNYDI